MTHLRKTMLEELEVTPPFLTVQLSLNGHPIRLLVDSGNGRLVLFERRDARRARYRNIIPIGKWITPLKFKATPVDDQACEKAISESERNKCLPAGAAHAALDATLKLAPP